MEYNVQAAPSNIDAEKSVLGAMLIDKNAVIEAAEALIADDFYMRVHQEIYAAMLSLNASGAPVDLVTLNNALNKRGTLEGVGGIIYLTQLNTFVPTAVNTRAYIDIVREKAILRRLIGASAEITREAGDGQLDAMDALERAEKRIFDISARHLGDIAADLNEVLIEAYQYINHLYMLKGGIDGVPSGFAALDDMTTGFHGGELILIGARPSMGKTALLLNIAQNAAILYKKKVAFFSLEMPRIQLAIRMLCSLKRIDLQQLRKGQIAVKEWKALSGALQELNNAPLFFDDVSSLTVTQLRSRLRRLKMERGVDLVIIDYLQLMSASRKMESRQLEVAEISRSLKGLAKELNLPIITAAQLSRAAAQRGTATGHRPVLSDLRESGAMEQDADVVMFLHREEYYNKELDPSAAEVIVAKQRNGPTGTVDVTWTAQYTLFSNRAQRQTVPEAEQ